MRAAPSLALSPTVALLDAHENLKLSLCQLFDICLYSQQISTAASVTGEFCKKTF